MNIRFVLANAVTGMALSVAGASAGELAIEGLRQTYANVNEIRITLRNSSPFPVNLDTFQPDILLVERQVNGGLAWVQGSAWHCANAGAGTPRTIAPGSTLEVPLLSSWSFRPERTPEYFEPESGGKAPLQGRYRVSVRYSLEPWSDISHVPHHVKTVVSNTFEVKSGGR